MFDYNKALDRILVKQTEIDKELSDLINYYQRRRYNIEAKRSKNHSRIHILSDILISGIAPKKKPKLTTKHPENVEKRVNTLNHRISVIQEGLKYYSKCRHYSSIDAHKRILGDKFNLEEYYQKIKSQEIVLEKSLYNHSIKLNRYQQVLNKIKV